MSHKCCCNHNNYIDKEKLNEYIIVEISDKYHEEFTEAFENGKKYPHLVDELLNEEVEFFVIDVKTGSFCRPEEFFFYNNYKKFYAVKNDE